MRTHVYTLSIYISYFYVAQEENTTITQEYVAQEDTFNLQRIIKYCECSFISNVLVQIFVSTRIITRKPNILVFSKSH